MGEIYKSKSTRKIVKKKDSDCDESNNDDEEYPLTQT